MSRRYWPAVVAFLLAFLLWLLFVRPASGYIDEETVVVGVVDEGTVVPGAAVGYGEIWDGRPVGVVISFDDGYATSQSAFLDTLDALGVKATLFVNETYVGDAGYFSYEDLAAQAANGHEIGFHSRWHGYADGGTNGLLSYADCDSVGLELNRGPFTSGLGFPDTTYVATFAYPTHKFNATVADSVHGRGFLAARTGPIGVDTSAWDSAPGVCGGAPTGTIGGLTWNGISNLYAIGVVDNNFKHIVGLYDESPSDATIEARIDSIVTAAYESGDNPLLVFFTHDTKTDTQYAGEGVSFDEMGVIARAFAADERVNLMTFGEATAIYRAAHVTTDGINWTLPGVHPQMYVFHDSSTDPAIPTTYNGFPVTAVTTDQQWAQLWTNSGTTVLTSGNTVEARCGLPTSVEPFSGAVVKFPLYYFNVGPTLAGKTVISAKLHYRTHTPAAVDFTGTGEEIALIALTAPGMRAWVGGTTACYNFSHDAVSWTPALNSYGSWEDFGPTTSVQIVTANATWYEMDVDITGIQAWADNNALEGGLMLVPVADPVDGWYLKSPSDFEPLHRTWLEVIAE